MQLNNSPVPAHQRMLYVKLRALPKDLVELFESVGQEICLAMVLAGERKGPLDGPVDVVRNMSKERAAISGLQFFEEILNLRKRHRHADLLFWLCYGLRCELTSHRQNDPELRFAAHHARISFRRFFKRVRFDHGTHAAQFREA